MTLLLKGVHHATVVATRPSRTLDFYCEVLGFQLLRRTVSFDEPSIVELYLRVTPHAPGAMMSFLIRPDASPGQVGTGQTSGLAFSVPRHSLPYWRQRLEAAGAEVSGEAFQFGERHLCFSDPDGLPLSLVEEPTASDERLDLPLDETAITRMRSVELQVQGFEHAARLITDVLGLTAQGREGALFRYARGRGDDKVVIDLLCAPSRAPGRAGAGTVQHVAWRLNGLNELETMRQILVDQNFDVSALLDRDLFTALYFRAPGGATLAFAIDAANAAHADLTIADKLFLPSWLEPRRAMIERKLAKAH